MTTTATAITSDRDLTRLFHALSNETRLQIARLVAKSGTMYCRDLLTQFPLTQPTMSHHLGLLVVCGVLSEHRDGLRRYYSVDQALLQRHGLYIFGN